jgi:hypothetical protein
VSRRGQRCRHHPQPVTMVERRFAFDSYFAVFAILCVVQFAYVFNSTKKPLIVSDHFDDLPLAGKSRIDVGRSNVTAGDFSITTTSSSSTSCLLGLEKYVYTLLGRWLDDDVPILMHTFLIDGTYFSLLITWHLRDDQTWRNGTWSCNQNQHAQVVKSFKEFKTILLECQIPNNDTLQSISTSVNSSQDVHPIYDARRFVECDQVATANKDEPPLAPDVKLGACLRFNGEWSRINLRQWIEYHRIIGIQHFWIYLSEPWNLTNLPQRSYVTYIPYDFALWDFVNHTRQRVVTPFFFQQIQNMHCLYLAKKLKLDWIAQLDVDEYLVVSDSEILKKHKEASASGIEDFPVLKELLSSVPSHDRIGGVAAQSVPFGRNVELEPPPTEEQLKTRLLLDYVWRSDADIRKFPWKRHKQIVNVRTVTYFSIHFIHGGKLEKRMDPDRLRLHHFKRADDMGVFRSSFHKGLVQDTVLRDNFREPLLRALGRGGETNISGPFVRNISNSIS